MAKSNFSSMAVAPDSEKPVETKSTDDWRAYEGHLLETIGQYIASVVKPLQDRVSALEAKSLDYCELYTPGRGYKAGQSVTFDGALYIAVRDYPEGSPGQGAAKGWRLAVKTEKMK